MRSAVSWSGHLGEPPTLVNPIGVFRHGRRPAEVIQAPDFWSLHLYAYHGHLRSGGHPFDIAPGCVSIQPPGVRQEYQFHDGYPSLHLYCHFRMGDSGPALRLPAMTTPGTLAFDAWWRQLETETFGLAPDHPLARASVWRILCLLAESAAPTCPAVDQWPAALQRCQALMEENLPGPLRIGWLAEKTGITRAQAIALFRTHTGLTPARYLRVRRVRAAVRLLRHTDLPVSEIGRRVGIPDPQAFNKTIRMELGRAPKAVRRTRDLIVLKTQSISGGMSLNVS